MVMAITVDRCAATAPQDATAAAARRPRPTARRPSTPRPSRPTDWKPFDPTLAPAPGGTEHEVTLQATETEIEVAPGVTQQMWTFDDQVPGPVLRGKVGDLFTVTLVNDGEIGHSIDFHASKVAWNDEMRTIEPGECLVYQFTATTPAAFMYHCGTAPTLHHIGNGMYGAIIIDPPELAPVDQEYVIVQSELYLGPQGEPGDLTKMQNEDLDAVVFNGYWNQYKFAPIRVEAERAHPGLGASTTARVENSSFHIVGTIFDTVGRKAPTCSSPMSAGGSQVLDLQPAQGGFVEFTFAEEGFYPMVTHKFSNVGKGALGLFQAGDVEMPAGAGTLRRPRRNAEHRGQGTASGSGRGPSATPGGGAGGPDTLRRVSTHPPSRRAADRRRDHRCSRRASPAVHAHLAKLRDAGLITESHAEPTGRGRPKLLYTARQHVRRGRDPYRELASMLARVVREGSTPRAGRRCRRSGRGAAHDAATGTSTPWTSSNARPRDLGFDPVRRGRPGRPELVLRHCPFADVAADDPDSVCSLHLGVAEGIAGGRGDVEVLGMVVRDPHRAGCRLQMRRNDPADDPDPPPAHRRSAHELDHVPSRRRAAALDRESRGPARRARRMGAHRGTSAARAARRAELGGTRAGCRSDDRVRGTHSDQRSAWATCAAAGGSTGPGSRSASAPPNWCCSARWSRPRCCSRTSRSGRRCSSPAPLLVTELAYDIRSQGRRLVPELAGSIGVASVAAMIVLADGHDLVPAVGVWRCSPLER